MESVKVEATERKCKDCGASLGPGREDRQYCDSNCKTNFNNRKRREGQQVQEVQDEASGRQEIGQASVPEYITRIQEILLNNRRILESLCSPEKPGRIRMRDLIGKGFNWKFLTSEAEPTTTGRVYRFCFEYGYYEDKGFVIIVFREREVD
jgi:hypothetical protein